ncbi:MAG: ATP-binding cassette domain-containing protein [Chthoniobacter sp.]|uniref:ATP-binding cassette domain-containing protein n=1 Tax=Chthoniobacter sp. TaxID=2510640 RepID=UPI0032ADF9E7
MNLPATSPLELRGVSGTCADGTSVSGISTAFSTGRLHILRGASDSGKTALFRFTGLLEHPAEGEVLINGSATCSLDEEVRTELRTQRLGFAFAAPFLLSSFSVIENVAMPLFKISQVDPDEARRRTEAILEFVGLAGAVEARVEDLEAPAQYRVAIARGLVNEPAALLVENLDGMLAGAELEEFADLLRKAAVTFGTAIIATASMDLKTQAGDRVLDISDGVIARDSECLPETCG